jgi:hypothetical protein
MTVVDLTPIALDSIPGAREIINEYANYVLLNYDVLIKELNVQGVILNEDPGAVPLNKLNAQIAQVDAQKTRTATIFSQAIANEEGLGVLVKKINGIFKAEFDNRLPQSPIKDFSNKELREGACNSLLAELKSATVAIEGSLAQAKTFTRIVQNELAKLDSTNKNISRQITVLQIQIEIGEIRRAAQAAGHSNVDDNTNNNYTF